MPQLTQSYDPNQLTSTPGYQFGMQQGQQALERSLAARGRSVSGAALKAASEFGNDYATTKLDDADTRQRADNGQAFSQLSSLANLGQAAGNNTTAAGTQFANGTASNDYNAANSAGAGTIAAGNQLSSLINQGVSGYKTSGGFTSSSPGLVANDSTGLGMGSGTGVYGSGQLPTAGGMADGGPVRVEPKIGTRSPLPGAGSGGLSRDAILAALTQAHAQGQQLPSDIGTLPANPVTNPGAVLAARMQSAGAYAGGGPVEGPGGPRTDSIPARLSNGEHVIDAASVTALGDGDNEKGQAILNEMRARIKAHAGVKPPVSQPAAPMRQMPPVRPVQRPGMSA